MAIDVRYWVSSSVGRPGGYDWGRSIGKMMTL